MRRPRGGFFVPAFALAILLSALLLLPAPAVSESPAKDVSGNALSDVLARLESNVSSIRTLSAAFVQKKNLAAFSHEIEMSGMVHIKKPSTLAWHVKEPIRYSVLITDSFIRQWDEDTDRVEELSFKSNPMLSTVLEQITVWFEGRYASLDKDYQIEMATASPVVLRFTPLEGNMASKAIASISVGLEEDERYLKWIRIEELGGDKTTITFMDTKFNLPLTDKHFEVKGSG